MEPSQDLIDRCRRIRLLVLDCDGVLTDGSLYFTERGEEIKVFNVRDGYGLVQWHRAGFRSAIISGRNSRVVDARARDLGIEFVIQGREDKVSAFHELAIISGITAAETAFVGDDTLDIPLMQLAGIGFTVADAHSEVIAAADYVTVGNGGRGAVREIVDLLLGLQQ